MSFPGSDGFQPTTRREARELEARRSAAAAIAGQQPYAADSFPAAPVAGGQLPFGADSVIPPVPTPQAVVRTIVVRQPAKPKKRLGAQLLSVGALLFAGALLVGTTVPANALISGDTATLEAAPKSAAGQTVEVSDIALSADTARANYTVTSYAEQLRQKYGNRSYNYSVGTGPIQWPFPYSVPVSDGFGERLAPCRYCSSFHTGVDFTPGAGTPIYAVAAGTVSFTEVSSSGFGNQVIIDHVVGGKSFSSMYAHMQMGSSPLQVGQVVQVGDFVGLVGSTGVATGAHLHLEIHVGGTPTDPFAWLKANAAK